LISNISMNFIVLLLVGGAASAQQLPCAPQQQARSKARTGCEVRANSFLVAAAQTQQDSMPMDHQHQATPPVPQGAEPTIQKQEMQMDMGSMEMQSPDKVASDVAGVQEPENPDQKTGSDVPVPDLLADARKATRRKLDEFEQSALNTNPTLKQSQALVRSSAGLARQAGLMPNPSIGYQGDQIRGGSYGGGEQGGFIQQSVVLGGKLRLRRDVFEQQRKADEIGIQEQKFNVLGAIRVQFYAALAAQEGVEIRRQLLHLATDAAATAHQLANVGQADAPDVLQTEVEAEQVKLDFNNAQRQYIRAYRMLAAVAGVPQLPLALLEGNLEDPPQIDTDKLLQDIVENSPSLKHAQQEVRIEEAALARDKREVVPDLTLRAGEQMNNEQNIGLLPVGPQSFASASIQIPIFNRNQGNVQASKAELERAQSEVQRIRLSLIQTAQPLIQQYLTDKLQAERYRTQMIPRAQRAYKLYLNKYQNMAAAYPMVLVSQRTLFQLRESYVQTLGRLWTTSQELQHYLLTDGLAAASPSGSGARSTGVNLPTSGAGGAE
jgi:cobalt-zinc-cadmium efflux system outer membrane protein